MTTFPVSTVVAADGVGDVFFVRCIQTSSEEECCAEVSGGAQAVDLLVDLAMDVPLTITVKAGDGPTASKDRTFTMEKIGCKCIPISTGETLHADGKLYFTLSVAGTTLRIAQPRIAVVKHINVVTH